MIPRTTLWQLVARILGPSRRRATGRAGCPTLAQSPDGPPLVLPGAPSTPAAGDDDVVVVDLAAIRRVRSEVRPPRSADRPRGLDAPLRLG